MTKAIDAMVDGITHSCGVINTMVDRNCRGCGDLL